MKALALSLVLCVLAVAPVRADENKERAQKLVNEGVALLDQNKASDALVKFRSAYGAYPSPAILLNIGTALRTLGRHAEAANAYARWILAKSNPQHKAEVEEILKELDDRVGKVMLDLDVTEAVITVDGKPVAIAGNVVRLEPGAHAIVATKGARTARATVQVSAGRTDTVKLSLATKDKPPENGDKPPVTAPGPDTTPDPEIGIKTTTSGGSSGAVLKIAGLSTAAVGLVAIGIGVKFGLDASSINDELEAVGGGGASDPSMWDQELLDKFDEGESAETKFIVFTAIGGVAVIAGGVMAVLGFTAGPAESDGIALTPSVTADSAGWVVSGRF